MHKITHIFLTGPIQIGKSTRIRAALRALAISQPGGFLTVSSEPLSDGSRTVHLIPAARPDAPLLEENRVGIRCTGRGIVPFPAVFESAGIAALQGAEASRLIVMDEIGRMEREAANFSARILALLDGKTPILGVVQQMAHTPLAEAVRSHPNVRLIEVTERTRAGVLDEILRGLGPVCQKSLFGTPGPVF